MKKAAGVIGIVLSLVFLILGFTTQIPDKHIKSYGDEKMREYVGGDAYNFIIEASLRGGEIAGAQTTKAIYFGIAAVLVVISYAFLDAGSSETVRNDLSGVRNEVSNTTSSINQLSETIQQQSTSLQKMLTGVIENQTSKFTEILKVKEDEQNNMGNDIEDPSDKQLQGGMHL